MLQMWNAGTKRIMKDIPEEYKKRWRIENNFKSVEQISMSEVENVPPKQVFCA